ncbi:aminotransferase class V-fold PLP-dependent enzyme [Planktothrix sp. FACHB-1355]|uniref:Aminotransferase class V-fold PLP-dependent enzyme n=1 Tax=Aerosakkonema funiforme FACHB-1375 TaxID=2949571 RepID=A0A926VID6_9CYAN|nr:aminotransferase class V-fold PLP-dependent enzyme [Aerosakkonema funiforme]MBD2184354.1 aminotransferase class V-fold PLP-dependent enzyme [Aerosakkonema funiforme FACHB-1375]MBD3560508.1 aminotransferase class V-fold PLP-dependent enzyme [Planktothrix sp. FACHB-1355]
MTDAVSVQTLLQHRQKFPALANKAYFNYGGQGPMPQAALEAIYRSYEYVQGIGPFSEQALAWVLDEANKTREAIAFELAVPPETISITEDVTVGCNIVLWGIDWKKGDRLLISDCEHPGIVATVGEIQRRFGIEVDVCDLMSTLNEGDPIAAINQHLYPDTRLAVLSHILWNNGQVLPLAEIVKACQQNSTKLLIDAAQSVGLLPVNLTELGVDFYAFTGHKWWCGPEGVGGLYVRPEASESLHPTFIGWRSLQYSKAGISWQPDGRRFEVATSAYPLYAGLRAAISAHQQWGSQSERYQQILSLSKYLWQQLSQLPNITCLRKSPPASGLVSFQFTDGSSHRQLVLFLESQGVLLRTIHQPDCVRACVHYFTTTDEIDRLIKFVSKFQIAH